MAISDLQPKQSDVNIELDIVSKGEIREFQKFGKPGKVCTAEAKDDTGTINLSLWNEQIDMVNAGDRVRIENGYVSEWQGEMQLTTGRFGKIEIIGKAESSPEPAEAEKPKQVAEEAMETTDDDDESAVEPGVEEESVDE
jgi:replication factor A1